MDAPRRRINRNIVECKANTTAGEDQIGTLY